MMFPTSFDDALKLQNTSVWMKNGYTMPYFPYEAGRIVFTKARRRHSFRPAARHQESHQGRAARAGRRRHLPRHPPGLRRLRAAWQPNLYATAIGAIDGSQEQYFSDLLFLLRRSAHHLRQLAQKRLGRHRRAPGHPRHERTANPHVHRPEDRNPTVPPKATAPSPTIRPAKNGPSHSSTTTPPRSNPNNEWVP